MVIRRFREQATFQAVKDIQACVYVRRSRDESAFGDFDSGGCGDWIGDFPRLLKIEDKDKKVGILTLKTLSDLASHNGVTNR
jgi:hypothetical protein